MQRRHRCDAAIIGGGIAGLVTALELLDAGQRVVLVDRDTPQRLGGLARWAFGGMAFAGTREQKKAGIADSPELLLEDWLRFGEVPAEDEWARAWARCYADESLQQAYGWLRGLGLKFLPAVNWAERGSSIKGNSCPRYHVLWGTGRELVENVAARLLHHPRAGRLTLLHRHRVDGLLRSGRGVTGCHGIDESGGQPFEVEAENTVVATGGINGSVEQVRRHWPRHWPGPPETILNGAHPFSDGRVHAAVADTGGAVVNAENMWNYAAGVPHPQPHFDGHGLSLIPCKSVLWLSPDGEPLGPAPMVTGFDTRELCRQVAPHPWTWQVLNWKIAAREMAISGAEHNPRIVRHQLLRLLFDLLRGSDALLRRMVAESTEFLVAGSAAELAAAMNRLSGVQRIDPQRLAAQVAEHDAILADPERRARDPAVQRILQLRRWRGDAVRTCKLQPIGDRRAGPLLAIRLHFISRKSLGGVRTDLKSRVLDTAGKPLPGLWAVGEAAGFGGGGACGKRSLEGTFLSGCILTARKAAAAIAEKGSG